MDLMKLEAHPGKLRCIFFHFFRVIGRCPGIGNFSGYAAETDAVAHAVRDIFSGFRGGNSKLIDLAGHEHLVKGLLHFSRIIEFHHYVRVCAVVEAFSIGAFAGVHVIFEVYFQCFHI